MASFMDAVTELSPSLTPETDDTPDASAGIAEAQDTAEDSNKYNGVVAHIMTEYGRSKDQRQVDEKRWLECYRNFRGLAVPSNQFTSTERSKAFIKITKTKVLAAAAKVNEVLFAGNKFPIGIEKARIPVGVEEAVHFDPQAAPEQGSQGSSQMSPEIAKLFGPRKSTLDKVKNELKSGVGFSPTAVTWEPAKDAARKMEKQIHDQLDESNAARHVRNAVYELCLFGHGMLKGPLLMEKEYPRWSETGEYNPLVRKIPDVEFVSIWDCYPDADARNMAECEKFIQRHRMSRTQLRDLLKRPYFRKKQIEDLIAGGPSYTPEYWENIIHDSTNDSVYERWEVLEYWGVVDAEMAKEQGLKIPKQYKNLPQVQVNCWVSNGIILRLVFNPFIPVRIPYHSCPYEANPYSFFGIGVAENMLDTQLLMNGTMRLAIDNAALSSNLIIEVNEDLLVPGQSMEVYPGKIWRRSGGPPGQAISAQKFDNVTNETLMLFDKARQLADEATGIPSYSHGMTGIQGVNRTASGMSMLMGAAAENIKAVVRNLDDFIFAPLGRDLFAFNMQYNFDKDYIGDLAVVAKGTESLMRNEIRSQKLLQLAQFAAANPALAPMVKWDYVIREYAASVDLDEDLIVNDPREAAVQAKQMAALQNTMTPPDASQGAPTGQGGNAVPMPSDTSGTGGGNIAPGATPSPGEMGFTGG